MEQLELYVHKTDELFAAHCLRRGESGMYIETPRMIIRGFFPEDAADLHEILGDEKVNHGNWVDLYFYGLRKRITGRESSMKNPCIDLQPILQF